ncbi:MAG: hypothetical protein ACYTBP_17185 [Planctomycetota bacterium]|jgi:hypothetical protein
MEIIGDIVRISIEKGRTKSTFLAVFLSVSLHVVAYALRSLGEAWGRDPAIYVRIKHFLFPLLLPGFTLLVLNYLEKFQIPSISECNKPGRVCTAHHFTYVPIRHLAPPFFCHCEEAEELAPGVFSLAFLPGDVALSIFDFSMLAQVSLH